ncbi:MAG: dodecin family protein [Porticoccaceae bacterium]|nr:dodecin family protein [Porticoccaceae bacterium]
MSNHVYKIVDIVGSSSKSIEDAIERAIGRSSESLEHIDWFEVAEIRGHITDGKVSHYQVAIKLGFRLNE